jgi:hypothetical protein
MVAMKSQPKMDMPAQKAVPRGQGGNGEEEAKV